MIGYYVHHHGRGHLHRAMAVAEHLDTMVVGMGSLPRPPGWPGPWMELPRDDEGVVAVDVGARGRLHWVPERDAGLRGRMAEISAWIRDVDPQLMVVDVSVEVSMLARLHGVPVVTVVLPGDRRDPAHELVHAVARRVIAVWPPDVRGMVSGIDEDGDRLVRVGGLSRFDGRAPTLSAAAGGQRRVAVLCGAGGSDLSLEAVERAEQQTPGWAWDVLGGVGPWVDDPWEVLCRADVVVTHAGQNAIAETAAARRPAIVVAQERPHREQERTAAVLASGGGRWPVVVRGAFPTQGWSELLDEAAALDGGRWAAWNDGGGAGRMARAVEAELGLQPVSVGGEEDPWAQWQ